MSEMMFVNIDRDIREMFEKNVSLCRYAESRPGDLADRSSPYFIDCRMHCHGHRGELRGLPLLRRLLTDERSFENPLFHLLFRAFTYGEYRFVRTFIPQNSQEERLTGHLISELHSALAIAVATFEQESERLYGKRSRLEFHYADMSSNLQEGETGADFALILHVKLPDRPESARVAVCQAKKLYWNRKSLHVDAKQLDQLEDLMRWAKGAAYYCFYDMDPKRLFAPTVMPASYLKEQVASKQTDNMKHENLLRHYGARPLSVFFIFDMLVAETGGEHFDSLSEASQFLTGHNQELPHHNPSRVLLVSLGGATGPEHDLPDFFHLFPPGERD